MKTKTRYFKVWTYDVWGNLKDGYSVNNRTSVGTVAIKCREVIYNAGSVNEFSAFDPTDRQLSKAANFSVPVVWDGGDGTFYGETKTGKPVGELSENEADTPH